VTTLDRPSLEARMRAQGLDPAVWSYLPGERLQEGANDYDKVVVVVEGSITYGMTGYTVGFILGPGERLDLPAGVGHDAVIGPKGVTCLEAHLAAGTMGRRAKGRGYRW